MARIALHRGSQLQLRHKNARLRASLFAASGHGFSRAVQQECHENFLSRAQNGASQVDGESSLGDQSRLSLDTSARVCVSVAIHELEEDP